MSTNTHSKRTFGKTTKSFSASCIAHVLRGVSVLAGGMAAAACTPEQVAQLPGEKAEENVGTVAAALTTGTYTLKAVNSNMCIDVPGGSTSDVALQQWACDSNNNNQRFTITNLGSNQHKIVNIASGKALHATRGSCGTPSTGPVRLYQHTNYGGTVNCFLGGTDNATLPNDNWASSIGRNSPFRARLYENTNFSGASLFRSGSDADLVPDGWNDRASSMKVFTRIQQAAYNGVNHQKFYIEGTGPYTLRLVSANQCVEVANSSTSNGAAIQTGNCNGTNNQKFYITSSGSSGPTWSFTNGGISRQNFNNSSGGWGAGADINTGIFETGNGTFSENACRFTSSQLGTYGGYLYLKAEYGFMPGGWSSHENATVGDRWCKSGELRTRTKYGPYGKVRARMRAPDRAGSNPGGKVGFIHALFTFRTKKVEKWEELDVELTGLKPQHLDTNLITTGWNSGCTQYSCTANSQSSVWISSTYWSTGQWHDYEIDWRSQSITWRVDGTVRRTLNRSQFGGSWPEQPTELLMNFWLPQHSIETSFGGRWTDADIEASDYFEGHYDWFEFERCTSGC